jgi:hypothetical protein
LCLPVVLNVLPSTSVTPLSSDCGFARCVSFGLVQMHIAVVGVRPFWGLWYELPLHLLLVVVVVVVVLPVLNFSFVGVVRFVYLKWFETWVRFESPRKNRT